MDRRDFLAASASALALAGGTGPLPTSTLAAEATAPPGPEPAPVAPREVAVHTTADGTEYRLTPTGTVAFRPMAQPLENQVAVFVDPTRRAQTILGIGGALTDSAAEVFARLSPARQQELLQAYYDPAKGIGYTLARTNIHSCDFSSASYTYVEEGDAALRTFSVAHDRQYRIPLIKRAIAAAGGRLTTYASPWSPPAFMKTNGSMLTGGKLRPEFRQAWADYVARFVRAYEGEGIPIWGLTVQNEPMATQTWESCIFTAEEERDFIKGFLGPTLRRAGLGDRKIIAWDHNRDLIYQRASTLLADPEAARYVWGIGFHWYEPWSGGAPMHDNVRLVHEAFPDTHLLFTEGSIEKYRREDVRSWRLGERYGRSMIADFNTGAVGWTDWNVLLDERGGPNHVGNFCFAPVHADTATGELLYTNAYHYIGHFSKFVRPGARRIVSAPSRSALLSTAFVDRTGRVSVVVMNPGDEPVSYHLWVAGQGAPIESPAHSIQTLVF